MELENLRLTIDRIDEKMKLLFLERLEVARKIKEYKKKNNLPILDENREKKMFEIKKKEFESKLELYKYYEKFLKNLIEISKAYQNE